MNKNMMNAIESAWIVSDGPHDRYESDPTKVAESAINAVLDDFEQFLRSSAIKFDMNDMNVEEWDRGFNAGLNQAWIILRKYRD